MHNKFTRVSPKSVRENVVVGGGVFEKQENLKIRKKNTIGILGRKKYNRDFRYKHFFLSRSLLLEVFFSILFTYL